MNNNSDPFSTIFDTKYQYHTFIRLNLKEIMNNNDFSHFTKNHKNTMEKRLKSILHGLYDYYSSNEEVIEQYIVTHDDYNEYLMDVSFYHNNPNYNQSLFKQNIIEFLTFLNKNPSFVINDENVYCWFKQVHLEKILDDKFNTNVTKMKL